MENLHGLRHWGKKTCIPKSSYPETGKVALMIHQSLFQFKLAITRER
jgi:hypothetical protein